MEAFQIFCVEHAAQRLNVIDDIARDFALVKIARPVFRQQTHGVGDALEFQAAERCALRGDRRKAVRQPDSGARRVTRQLFRHRCRLQRQIPVGGDAQIGKFDCGRDDFGKRFGAELCQRSSVAIDMAGHRNRQRAVHIAVVLHRRPGEQIGGGAAAQRKVVRIEAVRRDRSEIDDMHLFLARQIDQHEADTAQAAVPRFDGSEGEAGGSGGINRVAAGIQNAHAGFASDAVLRGNDAAAALGERFADGPVLGEVFKFHVKCFVMTNRPLHHSESTRGALDARCYNFRIEFSGCAHGQAHRLSDL